MGSTITRVGIPDTNLNQLTVEQLALEPTLLQRVPNPYFGAVPRSSSLGDPTITVAQLLKPYPEHTTVSLYRNNVGTTRYHGFELKFEQRLVRGTLQSGTPIAVTQSTNFNAFAGLGRSARTLLAIRSCRRVSEVRPAGSIPRRSQSRRNSRWARAHETLCAAPRIEIWIWR